MRSREAINQYRGPRQTYDTVPPETISGRRRRQYAVCVVLVLNPVTVVMQPQLFISRQDHGDRMSGLRESRVLVAGERGLTFASEEPSGFKGQHAETDQVVAE